MAIAVLDKQLFFQCEIGNMYHGLIKRITYIRSLNDMQLVHKITAGVSPEISS